MSIADDIRDRRNPFSSRSVTSKAEKARCTHVAKIRRIVEARAAAAEVAATDKSASTANDRQLAQKRTRR